MRYCIPDELFNRIPYPFVGTEAVSLDRIYREIAYKLPGENELVVRKEVWHSVCDFCERTGAYLKKLEGASPLTVPAEGTLGGKLMRVVGAKIDGVITRDIYITDSNNSVIIGCNTPGETFEAIVSVRPAFSDETGNNEYGTGEWAPTLPQYMVDKYGECITHGALMRLYAMRGMFPLAQMHATAYNDDMLRLSYGLITAGMRKHLMVDMEDFLAMARLSSNARNAGNAQGSQEV